MRVGNAMIDASIIRGIPMQDYLLMTHFTDNSNQFEEW